MDTYKLQDDPDFKELMNQALAQIALLAAPFMKRAETEVLTYNGGLNVGPELFRVSLRIDSREKEDSVIIYNKEEKN